MVRARRFEWERPATREWRAAVFESKGVGGIEMGLTWAG